MVKQKGKNRLVRNKPIILSLGIFNIILSVFICFIFKHTSLTEKMLSAEVHGQLITINTFFAGFLYNSLGTMIEFTTRDEIKDLEKNGYLDKYYNSIYVSIFFFILSIIAAVFPVFLNIFTQSLILYTIELVAMFNGIYLFIYSLLKLKKLINRIRNNN